VHPRLRRLNAEQENMGTAFTGHPYIQILEIEGTPAEKYTIEIRVRGLVPDGDKSFKEGNVHRVEVFLPRDFPRRPPLCRMTTPVFHPNIDPQKICIGDHWSAGRSLPQLVVQIAEMIAFQSYNVKSPLNATAAAWAEEHIERLPLEPSDLSGGV